jgi:hypothetical protein
MTPNYSTRRKKFTYGEEKDRSFVNGNKTSIKSSFGGSVNYSGRPKKKRQTGSRKGTVHRVDTINFEQLKRISAKRNPDVRRKLDQIPLKEGSLLFRSAIIQVKK